MEFFLKKSTRCCTKAKNPPQNNILCGMCGKALLVNMHNFTAFFNWKEMEIMQFFGWGTRRGDPVWSPFRHISVTFGTPCGASPTRARGASRLLTAILPILLYIGILNVKNRLYLPLSAWLNLVPVWLSQASTRDRLYVFSYSIIYMRLSAKKTALFPKRCDKIRTL